MLRIRASGVWPVTAPPIVDGAVLVDGDRIAAVGPHAAVPVPPGAETVEYRDAVLVPGLVNCHTHLELTHLAGRNGEREFAGWLGRVREMKDATTVEEFAAAAEQGVRDSWARGVTCVAETGSTGAVIAALARLGGRGVVYQEVFGPDPSARDASLRDLEAAIVRLTPFVSDRVRLGLSPHSPYTVSGPLFRAVAELARLERLPLAVHLAESPAESELVRHGTGPFAERLRARGVAVEARGVSPVRYLADLDVLPSADSHLPTLCIHCVQVDDDDIRLLRERGAAVAACPRSNRAHGHGESPVAALRAAGVPLGLGTDSVVSVPDLDLWAEADAVGLGWDEALRLLTIEGARALAWDDAIGSLEVGKEADLAVLTVSAPGRLRPPPSAVLTVVSGRVVHRAAPRSRRG
ncbi:MAG TPA: amidohydrolase family protein [Gemmatimonadales bacterium]|nr:amidohydrolase family protein [Gemmatimonadales bacterium]